MLQKIFLALAGPVLASEKPQIEQLEPGVFHIPLEKHFFHEQEDHPNLEAIHPRVGNWSDASLWDRQVKMPIMNEDLDNYMYAMQCNIGTGTKDNMCLLDSTTSISSTFFRKFQVYTTSPWDEHTSTTY